MMRRLRLLLAVFVSAGFLSLAIAQPAAAFDLFNDPCKANPDATVCSDSKSGKNPIYGSDGIVTTVVDILTIVIGVAAVIVIIIAGIQYMLSTGDPTKVNNSKNAILYAVVGLIIAASAQIIVRFIITRLN